MITLKQALEPPKDLARTDRRQTRSVGTNANHYLASVILALLALMVWQAVAFFSSIQDWLLPTPTEVLETLVHDLNLISRHAWVTAKEALIGFGIALLVGFGIAVAIAHSSILERALYPYVIASQAIPIIAIAPVLVVWFGFGLVPKVIVIVLITFFPCLLYTSDAADE